MATSGISLALKSKGEGGVRDSLKFAVLFTAVLLAFAVAELTAATPITQCQVITARGDYYLANDLVMAEGSAPSCLVVLADDVAVDGRGKTIKSVSSSGHATGLSVSGWFSNVSIKNVVVKDFVWGLFVYRTRARFSGVRFVNATMFDAEVSYADKVEFSNCFFGRQFFCRYSNKLVFKGNVFSDVRFQLYTCEDSVWVGNRFVSKAW